MAINRNSRYMLFYKLDFMRENIRELVDDWYKDPKLGTTIEKMKGINEE